MLQFAYKRIHKTQEGQTLKEIARAYCVSEFLLAKRNDLRKEPTLGQILYIPEERGNAYVVQAGDTKALLCGSEENYRKKNGTDILYIGMRIIL